MKYLCAGCRAIVDYKGLPYDGANVEIEELETLKIGHLEIPSAAFEWNGEMYALPVENFRPLKRDL